MDKMSEHHWKRRWRSLMAAVLSGALIVATAGSVGAGSEPCRVKNLDSGQRHSKLQSAVTAATSGDRIEVRGTCRGSTTIDRDLTVKGYWTRAWGRARLEGTEVGTFVLTVKPGVSLTLKSTTAFAARADRDGNGGGLMNRGTATLKSARVRGPSYATAIVNEGSITISGTSDIGNVQNRGELTLGGQSSMDGRRQDYGPYSAGIYNEGLLTLNGRSSIVDNRNDGVLNYGTVFLNGESRVARNRRGVFNRGIVVMNDTGRVVHNDSTGIYIQLKGTLTMNDRSWVSHNEAPRGAGVFVRNGTLTMNDGSRIRYNRARIEGGGLYVGNGTLFGVRCGPGGDANVRRNNPQDCFFE